MSKKVYGREYFAEYEEFLIKEYGYTNDFAELISKCAMNLASFYGIDEYLEEICRVLSTVKYTLVSDQELQTISFKDNEFLIPINSDSLNDDNKIMDVLLKACIKCMHTNSCGLSYEEYVPYIDDFIHDKIMRELVLMDSGIQLDENLEKLFESEEDGELLRSFLMTGDANLLETFLREQKQPTM